MAKDKQSYSPSSSSEDQEAADKAAQEAAHAAAAEAVVSAAPAPPAPTPAAPRRNVGDIPVTCLKTEPFCSLGDRRYQLVKGQEIMMDPSHASELAPAGWVAIVEVVSTAD